MNGHRDEAVALTETLAPTRFRVYYSIDVRSTSATAVPFDLIDTFRFDPAVTVDMVAPSVSAGQATRNPAFDGSGDPLLASGTVSSSRGVLISLRVEVTVTGTSSAAEADCVLAGGESGTGLYNMAAVGTSPGQTAVGCRPTPGASLVQVDKNVFGGQGTFTFDIVGSDGTRGTTTVTTAPATATTSRGVTDGDALVPGVTYTLTEQDPGEGFTYFDGSGFCLQAECTVTNQQIRD